MPGLQWLGTLPTNVDKWSYIAEALKGGLEGYQKGKEEAIREVMKAKEDELERLKIGVDLLNRDEEKKRKFVGLMVDLLSKMTPKQQEEYLSDPVVKSAFEGIGLSAPTSALLPTQSRRRYEDAKNLIETGLIKHPIFGIKQLTPSEENVNIINMEVTHKLGADWKTEYPDLYSIYREKWEKPLEKKKEEGGGGWLGRLFHRPSPKPVGESKSVEGEVDKYGFRLGEERIVEKGKYKGRKAVYIGGNKWEIR